MQVIPSGDYLKLRRWFLPERPGSLVWAHVVHTGRGRCLVDRWPNPRTVVAEVAGNYSLRGDPAYLDDNAESIAGFVEAPAEFFPVLRRVDPDLIVWEQVVFELTGQVCRPPEATALPRRLTTADADAVAGLAEEISWISKTLGGPAGLAASGLGWGAFMGDELASVAAPFFLGENHEDIGVVTEQAFRRQGLSTACAAALITDIRARQRLPTWTTSRQNLASVGVAGRLGFRQVREGRLYVLRTPVPGSDE
jgi:RimJ/RimL family protein N-acetyltransferase